MYKPIFLMTFSYYEIKSGQRIWIMYTGPFLLIFTLIRELAEKQHLLIKPSCSTKREKKTSDTMFKFYETLYYPRTHTSIS